MSASGVRNVAVVASPPLRDLVQRRLNEPGGKCLRIAQTRQLRHEIEAHSLEDVSGFVAAETLLERNRKDQPVVAIDQLAPRLFVTRQTRRHQLAVAARALYRVEDLGQHAHRR